VWHGHRARSFPGRRLATCAWHAKLRRARPSRHATAVTTTGPQLGESTGPLTDDQVATLVEMVRSDRREDYDFLCFALGVMNGPALWEGIKRRARDVHR
jgi:hypothetical protein